MKRIFVILSIIMILGCTGMNQLAASKDTEKLDNPRIVYRDLTKPKFYPVPGMQPGQPPQVKTHTETPPNSPCGFIEFANDSYTDFDAKAVEAFVSKASQDALIMVFGHSHGRSAVGTRDLATRRAETISLYLRKKGFNNVHVMASWGGTSVPFCPSRGVQLYALEHGKESEMIQVAFSKTIENEGVTANEESTPVPILDDWENAHADAQHALADD
ncbi:hypothetical protein JCM12296A_55890 [Desulfosarcina cetonica]|uniref:hypothetical protein n=1 Tax=Desulfosarcina cetonica TaxID=90730 RepID=UPI0006D0E4BA|nr:hypothetical protein [Desulfosarcina cetonica]